MNLASLMKRRGATCSFTRTSFDLSTGVGTSTTYAGVKAVLGASQQDQVLTDTTKNKIWEVRASDELLQAAGFPVPLLEGDVVEGEGVKVILRHVLRRVWGKQVGYICLAEGA